MTLPKIITIEHLFKAPEERTVEMAVFEDIAGMHKMRCLCFRCKKFVPEERNANCPIANKLFQICVEHNVVITAAECATDNFEERDEPHPWL